MSPIGCDEVGAEIPLIAAGAKPSAPVQDHLSVCPGCRSDLTIAERVAGMIAQAPLEHAPPPDLEERALARVGILPRPALGPWTKAATVLAPGLAAAAVVLAILGVGWREDARDARDQVASMRKGGGVPVNTVSLIDRTNHSSAQVTLMSDQSSTPAAGTYHLVMTVHDLPPTAPGYHYELWLIGHKGVIPSVAFPMGRSGDLAFNFPLDVDPHDYPSIEMTLEPDDGDPGMNGAPLMEGRLATSAP